MPTLDVSDIFLDPDFVDSSLVVSRSQQVTDDDGFTTSQRVKAGFSGIVTVDRSLEYQMMQAGHVISGAIFIATMTRLTSGQTERDSDIVTYQNRDYWVRGVDPYTAYGAGFVQAHCILLPFDGGIPIEQ